MNEEVIPKLQIYEYDFADLLRPAVTCLCGTHVTIYSEWCNLSLMTGCHLVASPVEVPIAAGLSNTVVYKSYTCVLPQVEE